MHTIGCCYMDAMFAQQENLTARNARLAMSAPVAEGTTMELILGNNGLIHLRG